MPGVSVPPAPSTRPQVSSVRQDSTSRSIVVVSPKKRPQPESATGDAASPDATTARILSTSPTSPSLPAAPMEEVVVLQSRDPNVSMSAVAGNAGRCDRTDGERVANTLGMRPSPARRRDMSTSTATVWPPLAETPTLPVLASTVVDRHDAATSPVRSPVCSPDVCSATVVAETFSHDGDGEAGAPALWSSPQPMAPEGPQLVGWTALADVSSGVVQEDAVPSVPVGVPHHGVARRVPTPTFVVPSRSPSVDSHDSRASSAKRWEEVRTPSSHMRGPTASVRPHRSHPVHWEAALPQEERRCAPSPPRREEASVRTANEPSDALAVAGMRLGTNYSLSPWAVPPCPAAPFLGTEQTAQYAPNLASYTMQSTSKDVPTRYTTEDFFPTKVRTSLSRSASPDSRTAAVTSTRTQRPGGCVPRPCDGGRPIDVELAPRWGDISNGATTATATGWGSRSADTPMDSLNASSAVAATAQAYVALSRNPCWNPQRVADAVTSSLGASCDEDEPFVVSQSHNISLAQPQRPPLSGQSCIGSPGCDVEVEDDDSGPVSGACFKVGGGTPPRAAPTPKAARRDASTTRQDGAASQHDDDVALDVTSMPSATEYQGQLLDALGELSAAPPPSSTTDAKPRSAMQRAPPSPAHSTSSFLTIVSDRAASARACSNDIIDRMRSPTRGRSQSLSAAMENVLPPSTSPPQQATRTHAVEVNHQPPAARTNDERVPTGPDVDAEGGRTRGAAHATSEGRRQDSLHSLVQTFGRNSEERELLLLEAQRQRVAAEAAVIEMQLKSMDRAVLQRAGSDAVGSPSPRPVASYRNGDADAYVGDGTRSQPKPQRLIAPPCDRSSHSQLRGESTSRGGPHTTTTLQDLFGMAARSATKSKGATSSHSPQETPAGTSASIERRLTHLEALAAATASPVGATAAQLPLPLGASRDSFSTVRCHSITSSSTSSAGGSRTSGKRSSTVSSCTVSPPSDAGGTTVHFRDAPPMADRHVAVICSQLRSLSRPLLSHLIRCDERTDGTVTLEACAKAVHTVLSRSTDASAQPCSIDDANAFVGAMLPRVHDAHSGGSGGRAAVDRNRAIPYASFVSTVVEIAAEAPHGRGADHGNALQAYFAP